MVFGRKDDVVERDSPVDGKVGVVPGNGSFAFRMVEIVAFVLEHSILREYHESMGKAMRYEKHQMIVGGQLTRYALAISGGVTSNVNGNV